MGGKFRGQARGWGIGGGGEGRERLVDVRKRVALEAWAGAEWGSGGGEGVGRQVTGDGEESDGLEGWRGR